MNIVERGSLRPVENTQTFEMGGVAPTSEREVPVDNSQNSRNTGVVEPATAHVVKYTGKTSVQTIDAGGASGIHRDFDPNRLLSANEGRDWGMTMENKSEIAKSF